MEPLFMLYVVVGLGLLMQCLLACTVAWLFVFVAREISGIAAWSKGALVAAAGLGLSSGAIFASERMRQALIEDSPWVALVVLVVMLSVDYAGVLLAVRRQLNRRVASRVAFALAGGFVLIQCLSLLR